MKKVDVKVVKITEYYILKGDRVSEKTKPNFNASKLVKGCNKIIKKLINRGSDIKTLEKEVYKLNKKIYEKENDVLLISEKNKSINRVSDIKMCDKFKRLMKYINFDNKYNFDLDKETDISEIIAVCDLATTCVINDKQVVKNTYEVINEVLNKPIGAFRKNLVKGFFLETDRGFKFKITNKVRKYYHQNIHSETYPLGTLGSSCMRYADTNVYIEAYEKMGVNLVVLLNGDNIVGRSLLWNASEYDSDNEFTFIDRIYGNNIVISMFKRYAMLKGWWYKSYQNYTDKNIFSNINEKKIEKKIYYWVNSYKDEFYDCGFPYMDTMSYLETTDGLMFYNFDNYATYYLIGTDGNRDMFEDIYVCDICGCTYHNDEINEINGDIVCEHCLQDIPQCDCCGEYFSNDLIEINGEYYCNNCIETYFFYCNECDRYITVDAMEFYSYPNGTICRECLNNSENYVYAVDIEEVIDIEHAVFDGINYYEYPQHSPNMIWDEDKGEYIIKV